MLELLFLLLPIAAAYGWYMGNRSAKKDQEEISNKLSRDYMTGVNFLLSNQQEKAVDLFLKMLEKQESENAIDNSSQFEAELTLGNLFRSRGEVDRALRIHQNIDSNPNYTYEQKLLTKQQLAKDFMFIGFLDRAEKLYLELCEEPDYTENALHELANIYQRTKEWHKAIEIGERYRKLTQSESNTSLSHYYCELALQQKQEQKNRQQIITYLTKALTVSPNCVRATLILSQEYALQNNYLQAINTLQKVAKQNIDYVSESLPALIQYYQHLPEHLSEFEHYLIHLQQQKASSTVVLTMTHYLEKKSGTLAAKNYLYHQLEKQPTMRLFHRFIQYQIDEVEDGNGKESLKLLYNIVDERLKQGFKYRCHHCGFQSHKLIWQCPSCRHWETITPIDN
ncbi:lipopolysaccharide assembly protein LapB [Gallibacterium trehalosifermentans]|uniref:Lipopolysaccharide assembly protein B n=1 Tax=Gallibacterium trehalosifermentans TaxID=516935 RepID=A0ABV6H185_9PAST